MVSLEIAESTTRFSINDHQNLIIVLVIIIYTIYMYSSIKTNISIILIIVHYFISNDETDFLA